MLIMNSVEGLLSMIKNTHLFEKFNRSIIAADKMNFNDALKLFEAMWEEGVALKRLPPEDPLEGIERVIKIAKIINSCSKSF